MNLIFFIQSSTVDISNYTIKDIPGSSGRLDVISRCILAALTINDEFDKDIQIWVFLDKYGLFIFESNSLNPQSFPKNELKLSDYLVKLISQEISLSTDKKIPLTTIDTSKIPIYEAIKSFSEKGYYCYILEEKGEDFTKQIKNLKLKENILFILGDQSGELLNSEELLELNLPSLSFGSHSYLTSSIIRLIKLKLLY